jgi:cathepsin A (carboxypeptidase C)
VPQMFFLDQPAGVGYSYSTSPNVVDTTQEAAKDFYAFMQLFLARFPEYYKRPFHVLSESYGGQYAPNFANYINRQNKARLESHVHVNLESVLIVNGRCPPPSKQKWFPSMRVGDRMRFGTTMASIVLCYDPEFPGCNI